MRTFLQASNRRRRTSTWVATACLACTSGTTGMSSDTGRGSEPPPGSSVSADTIFYDGFESGNLSLWQDGVDPTKHQVVSGVASAGTRSLRVRMPAGADGGWLTRWFMPGFDSVYARLYVRYDSDFNGGAKLLSLRGSRTNDKWSAFGKAGICPNGTDFFGATVTLEPDLNPGPVHFYAYYPGMPSTGGCYGDSRGTYSHDAQGLAGGAWHKVEFWVKLNTPGQSNSLQRIWVDGEPWGERTGLNFRSTNELLLNSVQLNLSATGNGTRTMYIDEVLVARTRPQ